MIVRSGDILAMSYSLCGRVYGGRVADAIGEV